ncbi:hypothetical protein PN462_12095 [Spirulina sp. CS-785/01]|uniref:hypothetical protein n=1 Tax=Spirulina sp. CS-785/01 TaxID=3021716 RepID=UPI00232EDF3E|nr:hypothetical protein [Spirulina sp. CS-785/01]MDB9313844.1 hypothetical protein [Spirulina sp. CS-785/01]
MDTTTVRNLTLTLYAFHLQQTLADIPTEASPEAEQLWESITQLGNSLPFPEFQNLKAHLISYTSQQESYTYTPQPENNLFNEWLTHDGDAIELTPFLTRAGFKLAGNIQPFRLHDSYFVDITLQPEIPDLEITLNQFLAFQPSTLIEQVKADLGKILMVYGEWEGETAQQRSEAAKWVNTFCPNSQFMGELVLFNCPFFLFEADNLTILISLAKPQQLDLEQADNNYSWLRELFWTQKKIISNYQEARNCYYIARSIYSKLEQEIQRFYSLSFRNSQERLSELDTLLKKIPLDWLEYQVNLRDLQAHYTTIEVNYNNFQTCLQKLLDSGNQLELWSRFAEEKCPQYLTQLKTHQTYLQSGQDLFSHLINTIRATAEVEQAQNEKALQNHIQAVGIGITAGTIVASSSGLMTQPKTEKAEIFGLSLHPLAWALIFSVICAVGSWGLAEKLLKKL